MPCGIRRAMVLELALQACVRQGAAPGWPAGLAPATPPPSSRPAAATPACHAAGSTMGQAGYDIVCPCVASRCTQSANLVSSLRCPHTVSPEPRLCFPTPNFGLLLLQTQSQNLTAVMHALQATKCASSSAPCRSDVDDNLAVRPRHDPARLRMPAGFHGLRVFLGTR